MSWRTRQSRHNRYAQRYLSGSVQYVDWEIIALFYPVIHVMDEYLSSTADKAPRNHRERRDLVKLKLRHIYEDYRDLYALCRRARCVIPFDSVREKDRQVAIRLHDSILANIRSP